MPNVSPYNLTRIGRLNPDVPNEQSLAPLSNQRLLVKNSRVARRPVVHSSILRGRHYDKFGGSNFDTSNPVIDAAVSLDPVLYNPNPTVYAYPYVGPRERSTDYANRVEIPANKIRSYKDPYAFYDNRFARGIVPPVPPIPTANPAAQLVNPIGQRDPLDISLDPQKPLNDEPKKTNYGTLLIAGVGILTLFSIMKGG